MAKDVWEKIKPYSGAELIVRGPSPSVMVNKHSAPELNRLLDVLPTPNENPDEFTATVRKVTNYYNNLDDPGKKEFTRAKMAEFLGVKNTGNPLVVIRKAVLLELPIEDREHLSRPGNR